MNQRHITQMKRKTTTTTSYNQGKTNQLHSTNYCDEGLHSKLEDTHIHQKGQHGASVRASEMKEDTVW